MTYSCLKHSLIPGTSRIFTDFLYHFDRVSNFYDWDPFNPEQFQEAAAQIQYPAERREALVTILASQNPGASAALTELKKPDAVAVVTGQQVGLFSGPAYTVYKAVTAVQLAKRLREQGRPAVPVFWLATEDHDLAEVDHAWIYDAQGSPQKLTGRMKATGGPVGQAVLEDLPFDKLAEALSPFEFGKDVLALVKRTYRPGATLGGAFRELVGEILKDLGLLFLDPLDPQIRALAAPFLAEAAGQAREITAALQERNAELEAAGYHAQVHVEKDSSPVFVLDNEQRTALRLQNGGFKAKERTYSVDDLQKRAADISPNALLRPVMQDYLLPTVAYVGGPAEVAYMAQAQVLYRKLLGRMPVIFPRNGFTLLDQRAQKLSERYQMQVAELLDYDERVRLHLAQKLVPTQLNERFTAAERVIGEELERLSRELKSFDPTLEASAQKSAAKVAYQFQKLQQKTARETMRRNERASQDASYLLNLIYPHRHLQERFYSILPFLAQHGLDLVGKLLEQARLDCPDHLVRSVAELAG
jgi:bacillithiol synthase